MLQPIGAIEDDFKRLRALTRSPRGSVQHIQPPLPVVGAEFTRLLPAILEERSHLIVSAIKPEDERTAVPLE